MLFGGGFEPRFHPCGDFKGQTMKTLNLLAILCVAWLFIACSTSIPKDKVLNFNVIYDTYPRAVAIYCDGTFGGFSPYHHTMDITYEEFERIKDSGGKYKQPACKALWASGVSANFKTKGDLKDFDKSMTKTEKIERKDDKNLQADLQAVKRFENLNDSQIFTMILTTNSDDAKIICGDTSSENSVDITRYYTDTEMLQILRTGILNTQPCRAEFANGLITKYYKSQLNLDTEWILDLSKQKIVLNEQELAQINAYKEKEAARLAKIKAQEKAALAAAQEKERQQNCLYGDFSQCESYEIEQNCMKGRSNACVYMLEKQYLDCKKYLKIAKKACDLGVGDACAMVGDEYWSVSYRNYNGKWERKYGKNCATGNEKSAFSYYRKACDLGSSTGCDRYNELDIEIVDINTRERDKTRRYDYTIKYR